MGYGYQPEALGAVIRRAVEVTGLPVYVTENGVGTDDDTRRVEFIERALLGVEACLRDGIDVRGYTYWSLFDNFEWSLGYRPTFGIVAVDRETQVRTLKPSARLPRRDRARERRYRPQTRNVLATCEAPGGCARWPSLRVPSGAPAARRQRRRTARRRRCGSASWPRPPVTPRFSA